MKRWSCALWVLVILLGWMPRSAWAGCWWSLLSPGKTERVDFQMPAVINIDPHWSPGSTIASSSLANPAPNNSIITCAFNDTLSLINEIGGHSSVPKVFTTNVAGIGYRILHPDESFILGPNDRYGAGFFPDLNALSVPSRLEFVYLGGTVTAGGTIRAGRFAHWRFGDVEAEDFYLVNSVTFKPPTCTVATPNIAVTLPPVSTTALANTGAVAGATAFTIALDCGSYAGGQRLALQFDSATASSTLPGVLNVNAGSTARNVGVQLTDASYAPITFGTAKTLGTTTTGRNSYTYYARYYALGQPVGPGTLSATATFTVSYP